MAKPKAITKKEIIAMDQTACSVKGVLDTLRMQLQMLDAEIKADEKSKAEYDRRLLQLNIRKQDLLKNIDANSEWVSKFDVQVGPFQAKYESMTKDIGGIYEKAKEGHTRGIKVLENEFGYHPAFKRPSDTFSACAFRPK